MKALIKRDLTLALRQGGSFMVGAIFYLILIVTLPLSIGANLPLISTLAPAFLWLGLLLSLLLGLEQIFKEEKQDGSLDLFLMSDTPLYEIVLAKAIASFISHALPLIFFVPVLALLVNLPLAFLPSLLLSLMIGAACLTLLGVLGASLMVGFNKGSLLMAIIILPFAFPILIFGIGAFQEAHEKGIFNASFLILSALFMLLLIITPLFSALALKASRG